MKNKLKIKSTSKIKKLPRKIKEKRSDPGLDLKIFIEILVSSMETGLDLVGSIQKFANFFPQSAVSEALRNQIPSLQIPAFKLDRDWNTLNFENILTALKSFPHEEASFVASVLQSANETGVSISDPLRSLLPYIRSKASFSTTLSSREKMSLYQYLVLATLGIHSGLSIEKSWNMAGVNAPISSFGKDLLSLASGRRDIVEGLKAMAIDRGDSFLLNISSIIAFQKVVGGNIAASFFFMAEFLRPRSKR